MTNTLDDYSLLLIAVSFLVSALGAFTALMLSRHIATEDGNIRVGWLGLAGLVMGGCTIWAMHFIGMLAYKPDAPVTYDTQMTLLSLVLPVLFTTAGLYVVNRFHGTAAWLVAGTVMGLGVAAMHYTGMAAMRIPAAMSHDQTLVGVSIAIAIAASIAALRIAVHWRGNLRHAGSLVMAFAVCGMHYTAMAAMRLQPSGATPDYFADALTRPVISIAVTLAVVSVAMIAIICLVGRQLDDVPGSEMRT
jgi:NO-binding membrane sensor protein with MHYT domain